MKRFASVLLAVCLMLSLSVFAFASYPTFFHERLDEPIPIDCQINEVSFRSLSQGTYKIMGLVGNAIGSASPSYAYDNGDYSVIDNADEFTWVRSRVMPVVIQYDSITQTSSPYTWINLIFRVYNPTLDRYMTISDFQATGIAEWPTGISGNGSIILQLNTSDTMLYSFDDGFIQMAICTSSADSFKALGAYVDFNSSWTYNSDGYTVDVYKYETYVNESSNTVPPFVYGSGAYSPTPPTPEVKDPNDHTQYGSASDQVEWYNDAYGAAVDPELGDKMVEATDMILQQEEIESGVIDGLNQYSSQVDPANLSFPTQILNGLSFIGTTFMGSYNALGDIGFVISLSMMLGVVLVLIGRGEGALARGMAASARERRRTEYSSQRDMNKGG